MVLYTSRTVRAPTLLPVALSLSIDNCNNSNASSLSSSLSTREEFVHLKANLEQKNFTPINQLFAIPGGFNLETSFLYSQRISPRW